MKFTLLLLSTAAALKINEADNQKPGTEAWCKQETNEWCWETEQDGIECLPANDACDAPDESGEGGEDEAHWDKVYYDCGCGECEELAWDT